MMLNFVIAAADAGESLGYGLAVVALLAVFGFILGFPLYVAWLLLKGWLLSLSARRNMRRLGRGR